MADRTSKINFALNSIPIYNGDPNKLSIFINAVNTVQNLFGTFNPPLDNFDTAISFLNIKSKITDKALDSIKDLEFQNWNELREHLIRNFKDRTNSTTIINELLKINNKNPYKLLEITKEKFTAFKSRLSVEEDNAIKRTTIINFTEKLIVNNFISTVGDPYRNNLATRNPENINEIETLLQNDFQYLKSNQSLSKPVFNNQNLSSTTQRQFPKSNFPTGPINFKTTQQPPRNFAPRMQIKNAQGIKPTPMSTQTRQIWQPQRPTNQPNNYFTQQYNRQPNYVFEELNNTEFQPINDIENVETPETFENLELNNDETENAEIDNNSFLEETSLMNIGEKS